VILLLQPKLAGQRAEGAPGGIRRSDGGSCSSLWLPDRTHATVKSWTPSMCESIKVEREPSDLLAEVCTAFLKCSRKCHLPGRSGHPGADKKVASGPANWVTLQMGPSDLCRHPCDPPRWTTMPGGSSAARARRTAIAALGLESAANGGRDRRGLSGARVATLLLSRPLVPSAPVTSRLQRWTWG
jgi:hypothetical protein